ncbi:MULTISPECIES: AI-2E family transporter [Roseomonadaceae]|uniref:AI-2E family transporter n=1 Tax=Falsiroseomonas oleicola TaxID=2801474 RepID=A0ABS6H1L4_9PROT|nr:AI-2E family transporter [Roseomonas oleicola]MBU8542550.1 AI-2E family transporter [Roseomonas oleicola]
MSMEELGENAPGKAGEVAFLRRVLIVAAVVAVALLLWQVRDALLLTFAGVVVAALLLAAAAPLERLLGLSRGLALGLVALLILALLGLVGTLVGSEMAAQIGQLMERLPAAFEAARQRLEGVVPLPGSGRGDAASALDSATLGTLAGHAATAGSILVNAASALVVMVVGGYFLAANPGLYRRGLVKLLPRERQPLADDALLASGDALRLWLGAQLISMVIVGVLSGVGSWLLGLPSPLALGLFAGLVGFVPLIGAVVGAVPPLLLAAAAGGDTLLWTALVFLAIQQLESNMIMPLVEKRMVSMPPALLLFAVVAVGLLFGLPGVLLAAPITVVAFVLVKKLYVRETLGQPTEVPGEED